MEDITISMEEMIDFIHGKCPQSIDKDMISIILDLQEEFLSSKGLIQIEEDEIY